MRLASFAIFVAALALVAAPASAAWQEYIYEDLGIAKAFPVEPERTDGVYEAPEFARDILRVAGGNLAATHLIAELENIAYRVSVMDISGNIEESINIFGECVYLAEQSGLVISNVHLSVGLTGGQSNIFGRVVTVDLYGDGGRMRTSCFVNDAKLYRTEVHVRPERGTLDPPEVERFIISQRFDVDTDIAAEEAQALADYEYFLEHGVYPEEDQE